MHHVMDPNQGTSVRDVWSSFCDARARDVLISETVMALFIAVCMKAW